MRIPAIQICNPQIKNYKTYKQQRTNRFSTNEIKPNNQISFGSVSVVSGGLIISKTISEAMKCKNMRKNVSLVNSIFKAPQKHSNDLAGAVFLLSKMKERFNWIEALGEATNIIDVRPDINNMQKEALEKIYPLMNDNNGGHRVAKMNLMEAIFDSGNYLNDYFIEAFDALPDKFYKGFKQTLIEKALNPFHNYNPSDNDSQYLYNLRLVQSIGKDEYKDYLSNLRPEYSYLLKTIDECALKNLTKEHNNAYIDYSNNFSDKGIWKDHCKKVFYSMVLVLGNDIPKLAQKLNIDEACAKDIIKDMSAISDAERTNDNEEKVKILSKRLEEKFANGLVMKPQKANNLRDKYYALDTFETNIHSFINKTPLANEFKEFYKPELEKIELDTKKAFKAQKDKEEYDEMLKNYILFGS